MEVMVVVFFISKNWRQDGKSEKFKLRVELKLIAYKFLVLTEKIRFPQINMEETVEVSTRDGSFKMDNT